MKRTLLLITLLYIPVFVYDECSMEGYADYLEKYSLKCGNDCEVYKE